MTRRERLERKVEKREEWAAGRRDKAARLTSYTDKFRGDWAFNTQPGHIPERARVIRMQDKAFEHQDMAAHHDSKASGLQEQLDRSIYSDDPDAPERIRERIAALEAKRERMKLENAAYRKGDAAFAAVLGVTVEQAAHARLRIEAAELSSWRKPHAAYELTNLGGNIGRLRERLKDVEARQARTEQAEAAPGGVVIEGDTWVRVTFAEKPDRAVLEALRGAGFRWGGGSWVGERAKLPAEVAS